MCRCSSLFVFAVSWNQLVAFLGASPMWSIRSFGLSLAQCQILSAVPTYVASAVTILGALGNKIAAHSAADAMRREDALDEETTAASAKATELKAIELDDTATLATKLDV